MNLASNNPEKTPRRWTSLRSGKFSRVALIAGMGAALIAGAATPVGPQNGHESTIPVALVAASSPAQVRPECDEPFPYPAAQGSPEAQEWAINKYIHGCNEALRYDRFETDDGRLSTKFYYHRDATREIDAYMSSHEAGDELYAVGGLALCGVGGPVSGLLCGGAGAVAADDWSDLGDAADDAVDKDGCLVVYARLGGLWTSHSSVGPDHSLCE